MAKNFKRNIKDKTVLSSDPITIKKSKMKPPIKAEASCFIVFVIGICHKNNAFRITAHITVEIPHIPIAIPLIAPSVSPISIAFDVPRA